MATYMTRTTGLVEEMQCGGIGKREESEKKRGEERPYCTDFVRWMEVLIEITRGADKL